MDQFGVILTFHVSALCVKEEALPLRRGKLLLELTNEKIGLLATTVFLASLKSFKLYIYIFLMKIIKK